MLDIDVNMPELELINKTVNEIINWTKKVEAKIKQLNEYKKQADNPKKIQKLVNEIHELKVKIDAYNEISLFINSEVKKLLDSGLLL